MPRKTKKQKMQAEARRAVYTERSRGVKREFTFDPSSVNLKNLEPKTAKNADKSRSLASDHLYVPDLVRTIVLAIIILGLELVLYLAQA